MPSEPSLYYQHVKSVPLAARFSLQARKSMFDLFMNHFRPNQSTKILDVGVTSDTTPQVSNYFEHLYPYPENITGVGTEDGSHLVQEHPGLLYRQVRAGEPLPFSDSEFDIVFSNAVVEHVGSRSQQRAFLREICRVGRAFFITAPNRWFPVEHHTGLPLLHYLPAPLFRGLIRNTRYSFWASEETLNIFDAREFARMMPLWTHFKIERVRLFCLTSNLVVIGQSESSAGHSLNPAACASR